MGTFQKTKVALVVLLLFCLLAPTISGAELENAQELEAFFDGLFAAQLKELHVPGATVAVVTGDEILFSKGYGFADLARQIPMTPATLHRPGSNGKILVWTAVFQLVEQGHLDLYADINNYLDFPIPSTVQGNQAPPITLHHLLTHTAGFEDVVTGLFVAHAEQIQPLGQYLKDNLPARIFVPGAILAYSNYGTSLAAYIVERLSGRPFMDYAHEFILQPLSMDSTTLAQPLPPALASRMAVGYHYNDGTYRPADFEYVQSYPAGGLTSSTLDMARLVMAHLSLGALPKVANAGESVEEHTPETRILEAETSKLMQRQQFAVQPGLPGMTYGFIEANYNGHRVLSHGGDTFMFTTGLYFLPEANIGLYFSYNSPVGEEPRQAIFEGFMNRYFPRADGQIVVQKPLPLGTKGNYQGVFHSARSNFSGPERIFALINSVELTVTDDQFLLLRSSNGATRYGEIAPGLFQEVYGSGRLALSFDGERVSKIHFAGPFTLLRSEWYQAPTFLVTLLAGVIIIMLLILIGWLKQVFRPRQQGKPFVIPKIIGLVFIVVFLTTLVVFVDASTTLHPDWDVPLIILEEGTTLKTLALFAKLLVGLGTMTIATAGYLWLAKRGSLWQRIYFSGLALSAASILWFLWQVHLF